MSISTAFIKRPIGTTLLAVALGLIGVAAWPLLPVAPLPQVDFPPSRSPAACPAPAPRPWPPTWLSRWSASSRRSRA